MSEFASIGDDRYAARAWRDAFEAYTGANANGALDADAVERLAWSAGLCGEETACLAAFERLYELRSAAGESSRAARAAFWLALRLTAFGEFARAGGWLARAKEIVVREEGEAGDGIESGYLRLPQVFRLASSGDHLSARRVAAEAAAIGERCGDQDLRALGKSFEGRALLRIGNVSEGLPLLDEAMLTATSGATSPVVTGLIYCDTIAACQQIHALDRAREWTAALRRWCDAQPQLASFAGRCHVHRAEVMQLGGAWSEAIEEAERAFVRLTPLRGRDAGHALYQRGEIHRLRGEWDEAERAYTAANERAYEPQPGMALLRLAQGRVEQASAATRRVLSMTSDALQRLRILPSHVEIMLASSDVVEARRAADELDDLARTFGTDMLRALALQANGAVLLAEGTVPAASAALRQAREIWQRLGAPYQTAQARRQLASAFRLLGDADGAALEMSAARSTFTALGATPDLALLDAMVEGPPPQLSVASATAGAGKLSRRELEVLRHIAAGMTNKAIADALSLSERTVDRHVSNIFVKLGVPSRAAATAWAYEHGVVKGATG